MPARKLATPRNPEIVPGLRRFGRHASYSRKGTWALKKRNNAPAKKVEKKPIEKAFGKKGQKRIIRTKERKFFSADIIKKPHAVKSKQVTSRKAQLRASITPGTVLILLAGQHAGRRVVFLKQLASGLLLVTGPYKINGVPLRRVDQTYVIATSTHLDISSIKVDDKFNDAYFAKKQEKKAKKSETEFFASDAEKKEKQQKATPEKVADQKAFDAQLLAVVKKVPQLEEYLAARFSLRNGQFPHDMKF